MSVKRKPAGDILTAYRWSYDTGDICEGVQVTMEKALRNILAAMAKTGVEVRIIHVDDYMPVLFATGPDDGMLEQFRNLVFRNMNFAEYFANHYGVGVKAFAGDIQDAGTLWMYSVICMPLNSHDKICRDYWAERMAMRYADGLPDDFNSVYSLCRDFQ